MAAATAEKATETTDKKAKAPSKLDAQKAAAQANGKNGTNDGTAAQATTEAPKKLTRAEKDAQKAQAEIAELERTEKEEAEKARIRAESAKEYQEKLPALFGAVNQDLDKIAVLRDSVALMDDSTLIELVRYAGTLGNASWRVQIAANYQLAERIQIKCKREGKKVKDGMNEVAALMGITGRTLYNDAAIQRAFFLPAPGKEEDAEESDTLRQLSDAAEILQDKSFPAIALNAGPNRRNALLAMAAARIGSPNFNLDDARRLVAGFNGKAGALKSANPDAENEGSEAPEEKNVFQETMLGSDVLAMSSALTNAEMNALETGSEYYVWRDTKGVWGAYMLPNPAGGLCITVHPDTVNERGHILLPGEEWVDETPEGEGEGEDSSKFDWPEDNDTKEPTVDDLAGILTDTEADLMDEDLSEPSDSTTDD